MAKQSFAPELLTNGAGEDASMQGRWHRQGDRILVLLDEWPPSEEELGQPNEPAGVRDAIQHGVRDENQLTDMIFKSRHPERQGQRLQASERPLIQEWLEIRDQIIRPAIRASSAGVAGSRTATRPPSTTSGVEAADNTMHIIPCMLGLRDQGRPITFVQRYLRNLTRAEAVALSSAGFHIVSCYEYGYPTKMSYFTRAQGRYDGRQGFTQAHKVGQPAETPVYFAVDTDPSAGQRQAILEYFAGVQEGFNQYLADMQAQHKPATYYAIGVYGSGCVLDWCRAQGIATWFWQAFAPGWCNNRQVWNGANIHTSGRDEPRRCGWRLGHLEGWGNEGSWSLAATTTPEAELQQRTRGYPARTRDQWAPHLPSRLL